MPENDSAVDPVKAECTALKGDESDIGSGICRIPYYVKSGTVQLQGYVCGYYAAAEAAK